MTKEREAEEIREVKAGARRAGFLARFIEVGGKKLRLDFAEGERGRGRHFDALMKIVFRGRGERGAKTPEVFRGRGSEQERPRPEGVPGRGREEILESRADRDLWMGVLAALYAEGKLKGGEKITIEGKGVDKEAATEAMSELEEIEKALAEVYDEEVEIFGNNIEVRSLSERDGAPDGRAGVRETRPRRCPGVEVSSKENKISKVSRGRSSELLETQGFEGEGREELGGMSAEEWFFKEILMPEIEAMEEGRERVIPQLEFVSLFPEEREEKRRLDFFVSGGGGKGLAIEIDDASHGGREAKDRERDEKLRVARLRVLRIKEEELGDVRKARTRARRALRGLFDAGEGRKKTPGKGVKNAQEGRGGAESIRNALVAKNGAERTREGINVIIWAGEEPILVQEVEFLTHILSYRAGTLGRVLSDETSRRVSALTSEENASSPGVPDSGVRRVPRESSGEGRVSDSVSGESLPWASDPGVRRTPKGGFGDEDEKKQALEVIFEKVFGFGEFREGQVEAIMRVIRGEDAIVLLPTGSGKSVIYQFLALILPGVTVIVEPLRALMEDQVENLRRRGIETVANLSEEMNQGRKKRILRLIEEGALTMVYMTPERMQMEETRRMFTRMKRNGVRVSLVALDEAHCVSEWGHDFRVAYLNLSDTARRVLKDKGEKPRILALTGTASENVLRDMERDIGIGEEGVVRPRTFDRPEIHYRVIKTSSGEKMAGLRRLLKQIRRDLPEATEEELRGIIFCVYKTEASEFGVEGLYKRIAEEMGEERLARYYGSDERARMKEETRRFKEDEAEIMIATKAFGMGIDKENVRYTVHFGITNSIEAYYQEAGRAGRDGEKAMSYILLSNDFPERNTELLGGLSIEEMKGELRKIGRNGRDDVNRLLFLHQKQYDKRKILRVVGEILERLGRISTEGEEEKHLVARTREEFDEFQKGLFRLKILNVIKDYTIFDFANNEFLVLNNRFNPKEIVLSYGEYVARYQEGLRKHEMEKIKRQSYRGQKDFILAETEILVDFAEDIFEKSRRRAILNMLELAEAGARIKNVNKQDAEIRRRILNYLGAEHEELFRRILDDKKYIREAERVILNLDGREEARLKAEAKRRLETFPEHPGLLMLSGVLEARSGEEEFFAGAREMESAEKSAERYGVEKGAFLRTRERVLGVTPERFRNLMYGREILEVTREMLGKVQNKKERRRR